MNRYNLIIIIISGLICCMISIPAYACVDEPPVTTILNADWQYVTVGEAVDLRGSAVDGDEGGDYITAYYWFVYTWDGSDYVYHRGGPIGTNPTWDFDTPGIYVLQLWAEDDEDQWYHNNVNTTDPFDDTPYVDYCFVVVVDVDSYMTDGVEFIPADQTCVLNLNFEPDPMDIYETEAWGYYYLEMYEGYPNTAVLLATPTGSSEWSGWGPMDMYYSEYCGYLKNYLDGTWHWYVKGKDASSSVDDVKIGWCYYDYWGYPVDYSEVQLTIFDAEITGIEEYSDNVLPYDEGGTFNYNIRPNSGWSADVVGFEITDSGYSTVYSTYDESTDVGSELDFVWNGYSGYDDIYYDPVDPGLYYIQIYVEKDGLYYYSEPFEFYIVNLNLWAYKRNDTCVSGYCEEYYGAYVAYNNDDDDADGGGTTADKDDSSVAGEDDLIKFKFEFSDIFESLITGKVVIERENTKINLWRQQTKNNQGIAFDGNNKKTYVLSNPTEKNNFTLEILNKDLWVEGYSPSSTPKDTQLKLSYTDSSDMEIYSDYIELTVFGTELKTYKRDGTELKIDKEKDPGNYIVYNNDDDDGDRTIDVSDPPATANEDDLQKVTFKFDFTNIFDSLQTGKVVIERTNDKLKLWKEMSRTNEIAFDGSNKITYDLSTSIGRTNFIYYIKNKDVYVEGANKSSDMKDTELTLKYVDSSDIDICKDPVKYTIFKIDLDVTNNGDTDDAADGTVGYIPGEEAGAKMITYDATVAYTGPQAMKLITQPADGTDITSVVYDITTGSCSSEPGFCMNSTASPDTANNDYSFQTSTSSNDTTETATPSGGKAAVNFYCKDYGGYCEVKATLKKGANTVLEFSRQIPSDTKNGNHCADSWLVGGVGDVGPGANSGGADDLDDTPDNDPPAGTGTIGDRLTRYEEYRGFIVNAVHTRTDPTKKDVFYCDFDNIGHQDDLTEANLGAPIRKILVAEMAADRTVTRNQETSPGPGDKAIKQRKDYPEAQRQFLWGHSQFGIPYDVEECWVYTDDKEGGINHKLGLTQGIDAVVTTIYLNKPVLWPLSWECPGKLKIENETITYANWQYVGNTVELTNVTRGVGGSTAAAHAQGTLVGYFHNPDDAIKFFLAHEAGHAMHMDEDNTPPNNSQMTQSGPGKANDTPKPFNHNYRHAGAPVAGSTLEFRVKN